jgi:hypothetical protein
MNNRTRGNKKHRLNEGKMKKEDKERKKTKRATEENKTSFSSTWDDTMDEEKERYNK